MDYKDLLNEVLNHLDVLENKLSSMLNIKIKLQGGIIYSKQKITIRSNELVEHTGICNKTLFSSIYLEDFGSELKSDLSKYWIDINFRYHHPEGGSNGYTILTANYIFGKGWEFKEK